MKYVAATLVGGHKLYCKTQFWDCINALNQPPERFFISCPRNIFDGFTDNPQKRMWVHGSDDLGNDQIKSTTSAREAIRQAMLQSMQELNLEWGLWLDNDIGVPKDLIEAMDRLVVKKPKLVLANSWHPARQDNCDLRHGMACTFTHRDALAAYPFTRACLRGANYGDDQIWLAVLNQLGRYTWRNDYEMTGGVLFDVIHFVKDGRVKVLQSQYRGTLV